MASCFFCLFLLIHYNVLCTVNLPCKHLTKAGKSSKVARCVLRISRYFIEKIRVTRYNDSNCIFISND